MRAATTWMQGFGQFEPLDLDDFERFLQAELTAPVSSGQVLRDPSVE